MEDKNTAGVLECVVCGSVACDHHAALVAELEAENKRLRELVVEAAEWNWLDYDAESCIPPKVVQEVEDCRVS